MKVDKETLNRWRKYCALYIQDLGYGQGLADCKHPACAWTIAHRLDIPREAYHMGCNDTHIETALKRIFPNAWREQKGNKEIV